MMIAWLVMALMLVGSIVYLYASVQQSLDKKSRVQRDSFARVRRREIHEEEASGRLSPEESAYLLSDLQAELDTMHDDQVGSSRYSMRSSRYILLAVVSVVALGSVSLYQHLGYAKEVQFTEQLQNKTLTPVSIRNFLEYRTQRYDSAKDWYYLADNDMSTGRYEDAAVAFEKALAKLPDGSADREEVLVQYAQALFYAKGNKTSPKLEQIVNQGLAINSHQATLLGLKGILEFDHKNYQQAVIAWQNAVRSNQDVEERQTLLSAIIKARQVGDISFQQVPPVITNTLAVKITWDGEQSPWKDDDVLLVYARVPGQKKPIAIRKVSPKALNKPVLLTNVDNLMSSTSLHNVDKVDVIVKLTSIHASDLTKGRVIGIRKALPSNSDAVYSIKVSL